MSRLRSVGRIVTLVVSFLMLGLAACTSQASGPTARGPAGAPPPTVQVGALTGTLGEPAPNAIGGLPPEDLTATPKMGGTLNFGYGAISRFDPHFPRNVTSERFFARMWASGLFKWDLKCNCPGPDLAESWEMAKDGLSYTFKLRQGVKFHNKPPVNGRPVTAEDIRWSLDRLADPEGKNPGKVSRFRSLYANVKEFQVVDPTTFRIVMKQTDVNIPRHLMYEYSVVLPKEAAINGDYEDIKALIGSGGFMVEQAQGSGQSIFMKNPDYYEKGKPYLDKVDYLGGLEAGTAVAALKTKQVDMLAGLGHANAKPFFGDPQLRIKSGEGSGVGAGGYYMNINNPPFNDIKVRRAFNLAIDRWEIYDLVKDGGMSPWGVLGSWEPWHWSREKVEKLPGYAKGEAKKQELEEAKRLLTEAGYAKGLTVRCECEDPPQDENMQLQLKRVGVTVNLEFYQNNIQTQTAHMKDKQFGGDQAGGGHVPDFALSNNWLCAASLNMSNLCDPEIERLNNLQVAEPDEKKRVAIFQQIQDRLWEIMPIVSLGRTMSYALSYKYVRGWRNPAYDLGYAHSADVVNVWVEK